MEGLLLMEPTPSSLGSSKSKDGDKTGAIYFMLEVR